MLSGPHCLQLLLKTLFSFIKSAGTYVSKPSEKKQPAKSNKGLVPTTFKGVLSGKEVIHMVEYDGKIQELIYHVRVIHPLLLDTDKLYISKWQNKVYISFIL
jgi:hypothetical protein